MSHSGEADPGHRADKKRVSRASDIFEEVIDLPATARATYLDHVCAGDAKLRREVESLLDALPKAEHLFESSLANELAEAASMLGEQEIGRRIGDYRLVRFIASGGMGTVYLAERTDPELYMQAAIKIVRPGVATAGILRRFLAERQLLANLNHPNIARLIDGGATDDGLPYLVMEFVDGMPLEQYCTAHRLSVHQRLQLMRTVCSAVHHAHRHLVVHRDLKPGNVLVGTDGEIKLLDFGIAKVLEPPGSGRVAADPTLTALRALTPRYASPEQLRGETITTASDIYSLGVILYQLLTGTLPYDIDHCTPAEIERTVCEKEVQSPSAAVRGRSEPVPAAPPLEPKRLAQQLSGNLDMIVLKAMRKEPERRYASVEELSEDIRCHLEGLPVSARPDAPAYRAARFVRRNRSLVAVAGGVVLLLLASIATHLILAAAIAVLLVATAFVSFILYRRANDARQVAEERTAEAEWLAYTSSIAAAQGAILAGQTSEARRQLEKAPVGLRGWEWRHLWSRIGRSESITMKHSARITAIDYSPDGTLIATASLDGTILIGEVQTSETRHVLRHAAWVESAVFTHDGRHVASAGRDHVIALWDVTTGKRVAEIRTTAIVSMLHVGLQGRLAAGLRDGMVLISEVPSLVRLAEWKAHNDGVSCVAFNPEGSMLATGSWDGLVTLWTTEAWRPLRTIRAHRGRVTRIDWSPDGLRIATGSADTKVAVWDVSTGNEVVSYHGFEGMTGAVLFDPDGRRVLGGDSDGKLVTFDVATGERASNLRGAPEHAAFTAARGPDSMHMTVGTVTGMVVVWRWDADDVRLLIPEARAQEMNYILNAAPSPDGVLVASASRSSGVDVWHAWNGQRLYHVRVPGGAGASCVAFSGDGRRLYAAHASGAISITEAATGRMEGSFDAHPEPHGLEPNLDGSLFITALDVHPCGSLLASAAADRTIKIWGTSGGLLHVLHGHEDKVTDVRFSPGGILLASCSSDSTIRLWHVESGREVAILRGHGFGVHGIAFSPDGHRLASASLDHTIRLWDVDARVPLTTLIKQSVVMTAVAYSADGMRLAAGGADKTIWILDPNQNREVVRLQGHVGRIKSLRFGADDRVLVSASIDGTVGVWDVNEPTTEKRSRNGNEIRPSILNPRSSDDRGRPARTSSGARSSVA